MKTKYWIKITGNKCPACGSEIKSCHIGDYCGNDDCPINYCDGLAYIKDEDLEKYKDIILDKFTPVRLIVNNIGDYFNFIEKCIKEKAGKDLLPLCQISNDVLKETMKFMGGRVSLAQVKEDISRTYYWIYG